MKKLLFQLCLICSILVPVFLFPAMIAAAHAQSGATTSRSIHSWVHCDGKTDDDAGVIAAFAAAKNGAFTLTVDCPVFIHVGYDIDRPIYIDNGTTVQFTQNGLFKVDNVHIPAFIIANSSKIRLLSWNVQYTGQLPVNQKVGGYYEKGILSHSQNYEPSPAFSDRSLTAWLAANRGIHFVQAAAPWAGYTNTSAIFFLVGAVKDLEVRNLKMFCCAAGQRQPVYSYDLLIDREL
ncbi:hypothetical protein [Acidobacterium sp. S8]|uniref:hypothetical protein n=1 Tax=Acidobacterium sp. S8 TaxID=1641854 RepID=UPI00131B98C9|nr:hypothetical protein [Acidobacterium sp. S8]